MAWFIIGSIISLLLETTTGPWWWVAYHALAGGDAVGLIVYGNLGAYLIAEETDMIISHLNNLKDREEAAAKVRRDLQAAREESRRVGQEEGRVEGREEMRQEVRAAEAEAEAAKAESQETISTVLSAGQKLTPEELENLPAPMRELLNRYAGANGNNANGAAGQ